MGEGVWHGRVIAGVTLAGTSGKATMGCSDTSKGEAGFVLHRHSVLRRTGLHSPITPCSKRATVGLLQDAALLASLTVRVLTHLGLKASTPPVAVPVLYIVKGKR